VCVVSFLACNHVCIIVHHECSIDVRTATVSWCLDRPLEDFVLPPPLSRFTSHHIPSLPSQLFCSVLFCSGLFCSGLVWSSLFLVFRSRLLDDRDQSWQWTDLQLDGRGSVAFAGCSSSTLPPAVTPIIKARQPSFCSCFWFFFPNTRTCGSTLCSRQWLAVTALVS